LALTDFTPSNARRFYSSMGNPLGRKGLTFSLLYCIKQIDSILHLFSKSTEHIKMWHLPTGLCATFLFLPPFEVICDLSLNKHMATRSLFLKLMKARELGKFLTNSFWSTDRLDACPVATYHWFGWIAMLQKKKQQSLNSSSGFR